MTTAAAAPAAAAVLTNIPDWILWTASAKGSVNNALDLLSDATEMIDAKDYPNARYNLVSAGEQLDRALKALIEALR